MIWIIALLCLGLAGLFGFFSGPIRVAATLLGLLFGTVLANPLAPLVKPILPHIGLHHPGWQIMVPQAIAFLAVLIVFKIVGSVLHRKLSVHYKYNEDDKRYYRWARCYGRLGLCLGLVNGAVYFFLLLIPIYVGGYFTQAAGVGEGDPAGAQLLSKVRTEMHDSKLDHVVAAYDPTPSDVYKASDIVALILKNPLLESRLSHYPVFLSLGERPEFQALSKDIQLQQLIQTGGKITEIIAYPKVQAIVTNADISKEIIGLVGNDLGDLHEYLTTGKSPKYDEEKILGYWTVDERATILAFKRKNPNMPLLALNKERVRIMPIIRGLTLTATTEKQAILKKENPGDGTSTVVCSGTWVKEGDNYSLNLPGNQPDKADVVLSGEDQIQVPRLSLTLVFNKE